MKRFWLVLLSLGLIMAFSTSAMAVDVKFSGEFYVGGLYLDKSTYNKNTYGAGTSAVLPGNASALMFQRLRLQTDLVITPGLILTTRADIMERAWGAARSAPGTLSGGVLSAGTNDSASAGTTAESENIAFDWAYVTYVSPIGIIAAGYMNDGAWGTVFGDNSAPVGKATYTYIGGPLTIGLQAGTSVEGNKTAKTTGAANNPGYSDADQAFYVGFVNFAFKGGQAGFLGKYVRGANNRPAGSFVTNLYIGEPYAIVQIGPVKIQAEFDYLWGDARKYESGVGAGDISIENMTAWIDATANFGIVYAGLTGAYVSGDDQGTTNKVEGGTLNGGIDWNPCLIMWNYDLAYWAGGIVGYSNGATTAAQTSPMTNAWFVQGRVGVKPIDKLDIMGSVSWAAADKKPMSFLKNDYGYEVDLTAKYQITNNLSYMLGFGYVFTGDFYRGTDMANDINNNYLIINKLTLTF